MASESYLKADDKVESDFKFVQFFYTPFMMLA